ncbi:MAG: FMN-binding protein [Spirochaetales bacterium]|nr:FMN-binding protein [Spirochaetales bacterium]
MNKQGMLYTVVITFSICFIFIFILSLANSALTDRIVQNQDLNERKAVLSAFGIVFKNDEEASALFKERISSEKIKDTELYTTTVSGEKAYAIIFQGQGLWGLITGVLAVDKKVKTIIGMDLISHNETPGLGGRIDEPWFKNQFRDKTLNEQGMIVITQNKAAAPTDRIGEIDAITAATQTSRAFEKIINKHLARLSALLGGR